MRTFALPMFASLRDLWLVISVYPTAMNIKIRAVRQLYNNAIVAVWDAASGFNAETGRYEERSPPGK